MPVRVPIGGRGGRGGRGGGGRGGGKAGELAAHLRRTVASSEEGAAPCCTTTRSGWRTRTPPTRAGASRGLKLVLTQAEDTAEMDYNAEVSPEEWLELLVQLRHWAAVRDEVLARLRAACLAECVPRHVAAYIAFLARHVASCPPPALPPLVLLRHWAAVRDEVLARLRAACLAECVPRHVAAYIAFLARHVASCPPPALPPLVLDLSQVVMERQCVMAPVLPPAELRSPPPAADRLQHRTLHALTTILYTHLRTARSTTAVAVDETAARRGARRGELVLLQWDAGALALPAVVAHAHYKLLCFGPAIYDTNQEMYSWLESVWISESPQAFLPDGASTSLLADWLRLHLVRSARPRLLEAGLRALPAHKLALFIQTFGMPREACSALLAALDACPAGAVVRLGVERGYMAQLLQVQRARGCTGGDAFAAALGLTPPHHEPDDNLFEEEPLPEEELEVSGPSEPVVQPTHVPALLAAVFGLCSYAGDLDWAFTQLIAKITEEVQQTRALGGEWPYTQHAVLFLQSAEGGALRGMAARAAHCAALLRCLLPARRDHRHRPGVITEAVQQTRALGGECGRTRSTRCCSSRARRAARCAAWRRAPRTAPRFYGVCCRPRGRPQTQTGNNGGGQQTPPWAAWAAVARTRSTRCCSSRARRAARCAAWRRAPRTAPRFYGALLPARRDHRHRPRGGRRAARHGGARAAHCAALLRCLLPARRDHRHRPVITEAVQQTRALGGEWPYTQHAVLFLQSAEAGALRGVAARAAHCAALLRCLLPARRDHRHRPVITEAVQQTRALGGEWPYTQHAVLFLQSAEGGALRGMAARAAHCAALLRCLLPARRDHRHRPVITEAVQQTRALGGEWPYTQHAVLFLQSAEGGALRGMAARAAHCAALLRCLLPARRDHRHRPVQYVILWSAGVRRACSAGGSVAGRCGGLLGALAGGERGPPRAAAPLPVPATKEQIIAALEAATPNTLEAIGNRIIETQNTQLVVDVISTLLEKNQQGAYETEVKTEPDAEPAPAHVFARRALGCGLLLDWMSELQRETLGPQPERQMRLMFRPGAAAWRPLLVTLLAHRASWRTLHTCLATLLQPDGSWAASGVLDFAETLMGSERVWQGRDRAAPKHQAPSHLLKLTHPRYRTDGHADGQRARVAGPRPRRAQAPGAQPSAQADAPPGPRPRRAQAPGAQPSAQADAPPGTVLTDTLVGSERVWQGRDRAAPKHQAPSHLLKLTHPQRARVAGPRPRRAQAPGAQPSAQADAPPGTVLTDTLVGSERVWQGRDRAAPKHQAPSHLLKLTHPQRARVAGPRPRRAQAPGAQPSAQADAPPGTVLTDTLVGSERVWQGRDRAAPKHQAPSHLLKLTHPQRARVAGPRPRRAQAPGAQPSAQADAPPGTVLTDTLVGSERVWQGRDRAAPKHQAPSHLLKLTHPQRARVAGPRPRRAQAPGAQPSAQADAPPGTVLTDTLTGSERVWQGRDRAAPKHQAPSHLLKLTHPQLLQPFSVPAGGANPLHNGGGGGVRRRPGRATAQHRAAAGAGAALRRVAAALLAAAAARPLLLLLLYMKVPKIRQLLMDSSLRPLTACPIRLASERGLARVAAASTSATDRVSHALLTAIAQPTKEHGKEHNFKLVHLTLWMNDLALGGGRAFAVGAHSGRGPARAAAGRRAAARLRAGAARSHLLAALEGMPDTELQQPGTSEEVQNIIECLVQPAGPGGGGGGRARSATRRSSTGSAVAAPHRRLPPAARQPRPAGNSGGHGLAEAEGGARPRRPRPRRPRPRRSRCWRCCGATRPTTCITTYRYARDRERARVLLHLITLAFVSELKGKRTHSEFVASAQTYRCV
ncbi:hypothetical protein MSG28_006675 [Choristoneura fumiferana]|uniref:Uncharacterized protein n=1 Tax=Choristoneura fumiferana TaxID=7141 RepID=A0ACC0JKL5_CHOFU|nr:hypothetical protein MSG28_006675 [Choristoneura fumiferana]